METVKPLYASPLGKPAGHYCHAAQVSGASEVFYLSGLLPVTPEGKKLNDTTFEKQTLQVFKNMEEVLKTCGCTLENLAQVRVYLTDVELWPVFNDLYAKWMGDHKPARSVVPVPALHYGLALEVEAVAVR